MKAVRSARRRLRRLAGDQRGTQTLEFALLLAAIVVPMMLVFRLAFEWMVAHYQMVTFLNGWPFP